MDETSWSQTWSTKSTATTNRKLLKRRQKCLLLQADQRLKQNQEDLPLLEGFNTVLIRQDKKFFTSELFKVIRDAIPLILHHRTMCLFRTISSSTFLSYWMCSQFALHHKFRIDNGRQHSSRERQTVFFTDVNPTQKALGKPDMKINFIWPLELSSIIERDDPLWTLSHQAAQHGMLIKLGLLKSGNLMNWLKIEQGDLLYSHSTRIDFLLMTIRCVVTSSQKSEMSLKIPIILE